MKQVDERAYKGILENPNMTIGVIDKLLKGTKRSFLKHQSPMTMKYPLWQVL